MMKKLDVIYVPKGAAYEYAPLACNLYTGCGHGCTYCYAPRCMHMTPEAFAAPAVRPNILTRLRHDVEVGMRTDKKEEIGPVLFCFSCDPYQPLEASARITQQAIEILGEAGIRTRILTKNGALAQRDFGQMQQRRVEFGVTICFDSEHLREQWEPRAGSIAGRMNALAEAHKLGIKTWVSVEPVIEPEPALRAMELCHQYVDRFAVGKLNHAKSDVDWTAFLRATLEQFASWDCGYYIKDALWAFADDSIRARFEKER